MFGVIAHHTHGIQRFPVLCTKHCWWRNTCVGGYSLAGTTSRLWEVWRCPMLYRWFGCRRCGWRSPLARTPEHTPTTGQHSDRRHSAGWESETLCRSINKRTKIRAQGKTEEQEQHVVSSGTHSNIVPKIAVIYLVFYEDWKYDPLGEQLFVMRQK